VSGYRPWLDGVRALAVTGVVVQHASSQNKIDLSSAGVGLFFGLSGYLITTLLMDERARRGAVSLSRFYIRRAARLFPALLIVVAADGAKDAAASEAASEGVIADALRKLAVGRSPLPALLTTTTRLAADPAGPLGPDASAR